MKKMKIFVYALSAAMLLACNGGGGQQSSSSSSAAATSAQSSKTSSQTPAPTPTSVPATSAESSKTSSQTPTSVPASSSAQPSSKEESSAEPSSVAPSSQEESSQEPSSVAPSSEEASSAEESSAEPSSVAPSSQEESSQEPSSVAPSSEEASSEAPTSSEAPIVSSDEESSIPVESSAEEPSEESSAEEPSEQSSAEPTSSSEAPSSVAPSSSMPEGTFSGIVRLYFHNDTATEQSFRPYVWCDGVDGTEFNWTGYETGVGAYYDIDITQAPYAGRVTDHISFIIKKPGTWAGQSVDCQAYFADYIDRMIEGPGGLPMIQVYSCPGEGNAIDISADKSDILGDSFTSFSANADWKGLTATATGAVASYTLYAFDEVYMKYNATQKLRHESEYIIAQGEPKKASFTIDLSTNDTYKKMQEDGLVNPHLTYRLSAKFESNPNKTKKKIATFDKLYDTARFASTEIYAGDDLGIKYSAEGTEFRLWSPVATAVRVDLYRTGTPSAYTEDPAKYVISNDRPYKTAFLERQPGGVFSGTVLGDLAGKYYTFRLYYNETTYEVVDPYAKACGINGLRGAIVDFDATNPEGWDSLSYETEITQPNQLSVYEVHVRDLTADKTWVSNQGNERGTYNAFAEEGTTYNGVTTGLDHIKELGVNAVQLLPVFDQDNDERTIVDVVNGEEVVTKPGYNWGYNPQNYNCVEGSYSSDPYTAEVRVSEYKNLIKKLADNDIRVIMDVVYNHVSSVSKHSFSTVAPRYFFRYDKNMNLIDDSGCGNCMNTDRAMCSKYIVDSCRFWAEEYDIKGFRFDLMAVIDTGTMRKVKDALHDIDPSIVVYGEGWTGGSSSSSSPANEENTYALLKDNGKGSVGVFNDCGRDGTKGNTKWADVVPSDAGSSFMGNSSRDSEQVDNVYNCLTQILGENRWKKEGGVATPANQTVNYVACHDNYTLYDSLNYMYNGLSKCLSDSTTAMYATQASMGYVEFSQGIAFLHGGDEFFRTKVMSSDDELFDALVASYKYGRYNEKTGETEYSTTPWPSYPSGYSYWIEGDGVKIDNDHWLVRNSYKYGDAVNSFKWDRKQKFNSLYESVKNLCQTRKSLMNNVLGQTQAQIDANKTYCWSYDDLCGPTSRDLPILAGGASGIKDGHQYYAFLGGRCSGNPSIGIGNGTFEIVYANKYHTIGETFKITNNTVAVEPYEFLILRQIA